MTRCDSEPPPPKNKDRIDYRNLVPSSSSSTQWARPHTAERVHFARDGLAVTGTLVLPASGSKEKLPVVLWFGGKAPTTDSPEAQFVRTLAIKGFAVLVPDQWWCTQNHLLLWCDELAKMPSLEGSRIHALGIDRAGPEIWKLIQNPKCRLHSAALLPAPEGLSGETSPTRIPVLLFRGKNSVATSDAVIGRATITTSPIPAGTLNPLLHAIEAARFFRDSAKPSP